MKEALANMGTRVAATEEAVKVHETHIESLEKLCTLFEAECEKLMEKTCDLESKHPNHRQGTPFATTPKRRTVTGIYCSTAPLPSKRTYSTPGEIEQYEGKEIHIFPDLVADVLKQRQKFDAIRNKCREHEVRCGFHFPSKFIVTVKEQHIYGALWKIGEMQMT
ncbi:uncharacterized protein LOC106515067 [Tachysurus ichikawai]